MAAKRRKKRKAPLPYFMFKRYLIKNGKSLNENFGRIYGFYCKSFKNNTVQPIAGGNS